MSDALSYYRLQGKILLADREYIGEKWLRQLHQDGIDFVIRLSEGCYRLAISAAPSPAYWGSCSNGVDLHDKKLDL